MRKTAYRKLAEKIAGTIDYKYHSCCIDLPEIESVIFDWFFKPTEIERKLYNHYEVLWLGAYNQTDIQDNNFRILCLLFMDEMWKSEFKYLTKSRARRYA